MRKQKENWIVGGGNNSVALYTSPLALLTLRLWAEGFGFQKTTGCSGMRCISSCTCLKGTWGGKTYSNFCQHYLLMCHRLPVSCSSVEITLFYLWALHVATEISNITDILAEWSVSRSCLISSFYSLVFID